MLKWTRGWGEEDLLYSIARMRAQDEDFCATLLQAIEAGMESCPIGVITEPVQKANPELSTARIKMAKDGAGVSFWQQRTFYETCSRRECAISACEQAKRS